MAGLKVLVVDDLAAGALTQSAPRGLAHRSTMLLRALLADLDALPGVEVMTATMPGTAPAPVSGMAGGSAAGLAAGAPSRVVPDGAHDLTPRPMAPARENPRACPGQEVDDDAHAHPARRVEDGAARYDVVRPAEDGIARHDVVRPAEDGVASHDVVRPAEPARWGRLDSPPQAWLDDADAVWPLALESDGRLAQLSCEILRAGRVLLGSRPDAIEAVTSKLRLARLLEDAGVPSVATYSARSFVPQQAGPWVARPDAGAGCLHTRLFSDRAAALAWIRANTADDYVLQPFVAGKPGSLSLICCNGKARVLACNLERVAMRDNRFDVLGSVVNGLADDTGMLARLAEQVAALVPGLWGHVGIDIVLTARGAVVLDVNPHLTAAYAGLHASIGRNPAGLVLGLLDEPMVFPAPVPPDQRRAVSIDLGLP